MNLVFQVNIKPNDIKEKNLHIQKNQIMQIKKIQITV